MAVAPFSLREDYWVTFSLQAEDREFLYNHLLEIETPLTSQELLHALVSDRIQREKLSIETSARSCPSKSSAAQGASYTCQS